MINDRNSKKSYAHKECSSGNEWEENVIEDMEDEQQKIHSKLQDMDIEKRLDYIEKEISPSEAKRLRRMKNRGPKFETELELAEMGITKAKLYEPAVDYEGMRESGYSYFENKEWLLDKIKNLSEEEALEILENAKEKYSSVAKNYNELKTIIQAQY